MIRLSFTRSNALRFSLAATIASLVLCPSRLRAQHAHESCPWLNAATAAGVLGGDVLMSVTHPTPEPAPPPDGAPPDATCDFSLAQGSSAVTLRIAVQTMQDSPKEYASLSASCEGTGKPLPGVGNEAVACTLEKTPGVFTEQVVGRVRERVFTLTWSMPQTGLSEDAMREVRNKLQNTAEQVAGSLF